MKTLWIGIGGAFGTIARYHLDQWLRVVLGQKFPFGTLAVNIIGSFVMGFLMCMSAQLENISITLRLTLMTGILGGFTTYSAFNQETLRFFQNGEWIKGEMYIAMTIMVCLLMGHLGWLISSLIQKSTL